MYLLSIVFLICSRILSLLYLNPAIWEWRLRLPWCQGRFGGKNMNGRGWQSGVRRTLAPEGATPRDTFHHIFFSLETFPRIKPKESLDAILRSCFVVNRPIARDPTNSQSLSARRLSIRWPSARKTARLPQTDPRVRSCQIFR